MKKLTQNIFYIGVDDNDIDLFEGQYVVPNGISYNSYLIKDDKIAIMDTVDERKSDAWLAHLEETLAGQTPDYIVLLHMEPDHTGSLKAFLEKYPQAQVVTNAKLLNMIPQFFEGLDFKKRQIIVNEGDILTLGTHTLKFIMAPMVHWPEVMMAYEEKEKILFSADAFGKFGALDTEEDWACEARRYYFNIVGKYGAQVQALLKKVAPLNIQKIYPLHGPMLTENLSYYIEKYDIWSSYRPEDQGVFIAYASIYGHTKVVAEKLKEALETKGVKATLSDLARADMAECVEDAFRYDRLVIASPTFDGDLFPPVESFIAHLKAKNYQGRKVALIENGSWAPMAAKKMRTEMEGLKDITFIEPVITIKSAMKQADLAQVEVLAETLKN